MSETRKPAGRILVGMSGGVDSAAALLLLRRAGFDAAGATLILWDREPDGSRRSVLAGVRSAKAVCGALGAEHFTIRLESLFEERVVRPFCASLADGETPNPCILCNRHLKFGAFREAAKRLGFDGIATGHYARVLERNGRFGLFRGLDSVKDQSYMLFRLREEELARIFLPLGDRRKEEIRALVRLSGLPVPPQKESQDICFVPDGDVAAFLERETGKKAPPGAVLDRSGRVLGTHAGLARYTVGQRKGLGLAFGRRAYVTGLDAVSNTVTLSEDERDLYGKRVTVRNVTWVGDAPADSCLCGAKLRYRHPPAPAVLSLLPDGVCVLDFREPQRAPTPGQAAVFYDGDRVLGGGIIDHAQGR